MLASYVLRTGFQNDDTLRAAFNALAGEVFGIDFEPWYRRGLWGGQYVPFTLFDGELAVSSVSANMLDLVLDGKPHKAVQFGTVMTRPEYRNQGLARHLMQHAMKTLQDRCDLFYLMGDKHAVGFYRKLGFEAVAESAFTLRLPAAALQGLEMPGAGRFLQPDRPEDMQVILDAASMRESVSLTAGVLDAGYLLGFYAMHGFENRFYWIRRTAEGRDHPPVTAGSRFADTDWLVVFHEADGILHLHDVLATRMPSVRQVLAGLPHGTCHAVSFGFTPDRMGIAAEDGVLETEPRVNEDTFFVRSGIGFATPPFLYPPIGLA